MKKKVPALLAAFIITALITLAMGAVSVNALFNPNSVAVSNSPAAASTGTSNASLEQAQIQQLQARIGEYQQREGQYQNQLQNAQQQLQQANTQLQQANLQLQQFQQFILALQRSGLIQIQPDGTVVIAGRGGDTN